MLRDVIVFVYDRGPARKPMLLPYLTTYAYTPPRRGGGYNLITVDVEPGPNSGRKAKQEACKVVRQWLKEGPGFVNIDYRGYDSAG